MDHPSQTDLSAYVDGEAADLAVLEAHVTACTPCGKEVAFLRSLSDAIATLPVIELPAGFAMSVQQRLIPYPRRSKRFTIAASLLFGLLTLIGGIASIGWGLLTEAGIPGRVASKAATSIETVLSILGSVTLVARICINVAEVLISSLAMVLAHIGVGYILALLILAATSSYFLRRNITTYRKERMA